MKDKKREKTEKPVDEQTLWILLRKQSYPRSSRKKINHGDYHGHLFRDLRRDRPRLLI